MKDIQAQVRKIRSDATECLMLSNLVAEERRDLFARIAEHLNSLALEIETESVTNVADGPAAAPDQQVDFPGHDAARTDQKATRSWHRHPWPPFVALLVIAGVVFWAMNRTEMRSFSLANLLTKTEPASQDSNQELAALLSAERAERKVLGEQLNALIARLDSLAKDLDDLKSFRTAIPMSPGKGVAGPEDKSPGTEARPSAAVERDTGTETSSTSSNVSVTAEQAPALPTAATNPLGESGDRVESIPPARAEPDPRKLAIGPVGCTHFRSFDPASGTYTTFDGRRRQCR